MAALRPLVVVDTDILIDVSRAEEQAVRFLQSLEASHRPVVSPITQMELFVGCRNKRELQQTVQFLKRFGVAHLASKNQRDYRFISDLRLLPYP